MNEETGSDLGAVLEEGVLGTQVREGAVEVRQDEGRVCGSDQVHEAPFADGTSNTFLLRRQTHKLLETLNYPFYTWTMHMPGTGLNYPKP